MTVLEELNDPESKADAARVLAWSTVHLGSATPEDIRRLGWMVAVHNDYRQDGCFFTFWLFTKDGRAVKGEGLTDTQALDRVRIQIQGT